VSYTAFVSAESVSGHVVYCLISNCSVIYSFPTVQSSTTQLVQQFKLFKSFKFPKRKFGKKGEERTIICMCIIFDSQNIHVILLYDNYNYTQIQSQSKQFLNFGHALESSMLCMLFFENHGS